MTRCGPSPCWSSRRRARCCWPPRSRSCPGCPGPRTWASSSRAAARWKRLAGGRVMLFDKTGTLTQGRPVAGRRDHRRRGFDADEVLRLAASLDQVSAARAGQRDRHRRHPARAGPGDARERPRGPRLRPGGHRRRPSGQARQGVLDRRRHHPAVGAAGAPPRRPGRLADRLRRRRRRARRGVPAAGRDPARRPPDGPRAARRPGSPGSSWSPATAPTSRT